MTASLDELALFLKGIGTETKIKETTDSHGIARTRIHAYTEGVSLGKPHAAENGTLKIDLSDCVFDVDFDCDGIDLVTLERIPDEINGSLSCAFNKIASLDELIDKKISKDIIIRENPICPLLFSGKLIADGSAHRFFDNANCDIGLDRKQFNALNDECARLGVQPPVPSGIFTLDTDIVYIPKQLMAEFYQSLQDRMLALAEENHIHPTTIIPPAFKFKLKGRAP